MQRAKCKYLLANATNRPKHFFWAVCCDWPLCPSDTSNVYTENGIDHWRDTDRGNWKCLEITEVLDNRSVRG